MSPMKSSSGLDENIAGMLCYLFTFVGGIVFLAVEKRSRFVLFHALQSVTVFGLIMVGHVLCAFLPLFGPLLASLLSMLGVVVWLLMVVTSLQGKWLKLPWVGDFAEKQMRHLQYVTLYRLPPKVIHPVSLHNNPSCFRQKKRKNTGSPAL